LWRRDQNAGKFGSPWTPALAGLVEDGERAIASGRPKPRDFAPRPWCADPCGSNRNERRRAGSWIAATAPPAAAVLKATWPAGGFRPHFDEPRRIEMRWRTRNKPRKASARTPLSGRLTASIMMAPATMRGQTRFDAAAHLLGPRLGAAEILCCRRRRRELAVKRGPPVQPTRPSTMTAFLAAIFFAHAISVSAARGSSRWSLPAKSLEQATTCLVDACDRQRIGDDGD